MEINWDQLKDLAEQLGEPRGGGGNARHEDLQIIDQALDTLLAKENYADIVKLRSYFTAVVARDSISVHKSLQRLTDEAIRAADKIGDIKEQAHLLGANGHNLHRQGLHQQSLDNFYLAYQIYEQAGEPFEALKNYFMMSLCHRALGNVTEAIHILQNVMAKVDPDDPWFGNPLNVLAWIERDNGHLTTAEIMFRRALALLKQSSDPDILVAGTLADLGEVLGLQGKDEEAATCFADSLALIRKYEGQYDRQEARTETKLAELLIRQKKYAEALSLLNHADDLIAYGAYKDQLWKIELLRAMIHFRQRNISGAIQRLRSAKTIYEELGLPGSEFIRHTVNRVKLRSGLLTLKGK